MGSLEPGKLADIVLWSPGFFGVKPQTVIKSGVIVWTAMGEGNASVGSARDGYYSVAAHVPSFHDRLVQATT